MAFSRFEDGTIREDWVLDDTFSLFQQLGFIDSHEEWSTLSFRAGWTRRGRRNEIGAATVFSS